MATRTMTRFFHALRRTMLLKESGGLSDGQLLQCFLARREEAAFEAIIQQHGPMVLGVCRRVLQNVHDAEDAFQATFLVFLRKAATIWPREFVGNWLHGVAYRTALKARAAAARRRVKESQVRDMGRTEAPESDVWRDLQPVLDQELNGLPDHYRLPIVLCDLEGKSRKEVAGRLGWPEGTLSGRLARARMMLARRLARRGVTLSGGALAATIAQNTAAASVPAPLVASVVKAAALTTAGKAIAGGVISPKVAALLDGVLKTMLLAKLKIAAVLLLAAAVLALGTVLLCHRPVAETAWAAAPKKSEAARPAARASSRPGEKLTIYSGRVVGVAEDGRRLTLALKPRKKGEKPAHIDVVLSAQTAVTYFGIGPGGARPAKGYRAVAWLKEGTRDPAVRLRLQGEEGLKKPADVAGPVAAVSEDGSGITLSIPAKAVKGKKKPEPKQLPIRFTEDTVLTFTNVGEDGARLNAGYHVSVWLEKGSGDTASAVLFDGGKEIQKKGVVGPRGDLQPDKAGTVVALAVDGTGLTLEALAPKKKGQAPQKPQRLDIKIDDGTEIAYFGVGADGARPAVGYGIRVWLQEGSKAIAARVWLTRGKAKRTMLAGKVAGIAADGRTLTLEVPKTKKGRDSRRVELRIAPRTSIIYNGVGPKEARLTAGYRAVALLLEGSTDTLETMTLEKVSPP